jgi:alkyl hydroperoxide reductase subunit D
MEWVNILKEQMPEYARDIIINLESTCLRSSLKPDVATSVAMCAAMTLGNNKIVDIIRDHGNISGPHLSAIQIAVSLMAMNNIYYPYVEMTNDPEMKSLRPELRMAAYATFGGVDKLSFELYGLASSIVGKCHFCISNHYDLLKKDGMSLTELRDVGRIVSVIVAVSRCLENA